jgi:hypothetical protein
MRYVMVAVSDTPRSFPRHRYRVRVQRLCGMESRLQPASRTCFSNHSNCRTLGKGQHFNRLKPGLHTRVLSRPFGTTADLTSRAHPTLKGWAIVESSLRDADRKSSSRSEREFDWFKKQGSEAGTPYPGGCFQRGDYPRRKNSSMTSATRRTCSSVSSG